MRYEIEATVFFDKWLAGIKDRNTRARIFHRFDSIHLGNFGDHKNLGDNLFELRFFFGPGYRVYFTIQRERVILLICGGDKSTQAKDIAKAKKIIITLEG